MSPPFGNDATLAECCELIDEMKTIYSCADDVEQVSRTIRTYEELVEACNEKELLAKDAVRGWTQRAAVATQRAQEPEPLGGHRQRVANLEEQKRQAEANVQNLQQEAKVLSETQERLTSQDAQHQEQQDQLEAVQVQHIPDLRYELSLYTHITKINWHYEATDRVQGHLTNSKVGSVKHFDLDPNTMSEYEIVDHLWNLMV
uniref:Kinetochore protein Spc24 n=1 Tax=Pyramimonas obovata TaxID=1411642 RepID=A0A7S0QXS1_9CHLO|mmetsp:Transcript_17226/g.37467  ORF Transcript_17226/g.37467 Transcript_17226/m.37467 type:complete len:202 (+) Transcript_17226:160-765(+)|eukprot:CAMPEP_0118924182 /NCGR_PEP_ID=MMETSP1169-20130426/2436_1 /TAXON_ID=36882 /ORGANISM="Pyramimonas obovata, Strain CCMP722" /LENGTH=201 /DNA_ID=CAMNT_0006865271 /DNA_START=155 /DNA_END=760 /DNA_ORIENTATION=+